MQVNFSARDWKFGISREQLLDGKPVREVSLPDGIWSMWNTIIITSFSIGLIHFKWQAQGPCKVTSSRIVKSYPKSGTWGTGEFDL